MISLFLQGTPIKQENFFSFPTISEQPNMQNNKKDQLLHENHVVDY